MTVRMTHSFDRGREVNIPELATQVVDKRRSNSIATLKSIDQSPGHALLFEQVFA